MLKSMTGFGRATIEAEGMLWTIEISSVNSRFLEVQTRLPRLLAGLEFALRKRVGEALSRGKITVSISWEILPHAGSGVLVNRPMAEGYIKQLRELQTTYGLGGEISIATIAALPDLFVTALDGGDKESREERLLAATAQALDALESMRKTEGNRLGEDIAARIGLIRFELQSVEAEAETYAKGLAEKVQSRIKQLFGEVGMDPQRLAQEAVFLAERADVTEERIRLAAHLDEFEATLAKGGEVGRRFNFLLQEMVRETNTIGSKTGELSVIRRVVRIKEELEKVREQVQNLE
jgi:uncharacterized protein (TIGR00255 family)